MKTSIRVSMVVASALSVTSGLSMALSPVAGGTISWPDDGWYQVQKADTYEEICQGGTHCSVSSGTYNVINLSTGMRYDNVVVVDGEDVVIGLADDTGIEIDGNTIRWPDDGWYQVQSSTTYESFCQGGRSCTVPDGSYNVINLTTGERFENIVVAGSSGDNDGVQVSGNTIRWPDDGWYQVQDATTYASLCQGGTSCEVPNGTYNVINLTTGERFEGVVVSGGLTGGTSDYLLSATNVNTWLPEVFAVLNADALQDFYDHLSLQELEVSTEAEAEALENFIFIGSNYNEDTSQLEFSYDCVDGGRVTSGAMRGASHAGYYMTADDCSVGSETYDGDFSEHSFGSHGAYSHFIEFGPELTLTRADAGSVIVSASWAGQQAQLGYLTLERNIELFADAGFEIVNFQSTLAFDDSQSSAEESDISPKSFTASGSFADRWTDGLMVQFDTLDEFSNFGADHTYQSGELRLTAPDGSRVVLNADNGDPASFQLDIQEGNTSTSMSIDWSDTLHLPCLGRSLEDESGCEDIYHYSVF